MVWARALSAAIPVGATVACNSPPGRLLAYCTSRVLPVPARPVISTTGVPASMAASASPTPGEAS